MDADLGIPEAPECADEGQGMLSRRTLVEALCGLAALQLSGSGCAPEEPKRPGEVAIPVRDLVPGLRRIVIVAGNPVEVLRNDQGIVARSLRCTHMGCVVKWKEDQRAYVCPCHDGRYDETGAVVAGPPIAPLRLVAVRVSEGRALVGG